MKKVHLIILDGVGFGSCDRGDAFCHAHKPYLQSLLDTYPTTRLKTDGEVVGLPSFQTGGSEVGHITIGSGRAVKHLLTRINDQIETGEFFENPVLKDLFQKAQSRGRIHFMGLVSDGGIHSFLPHLFGLQKMAKDYGIEKVFIHSFLDGRDVGERTAGEYLQQIENQESGQIASIGGRFFAMDRDQNWDRVQKAYEVMTSLQVRPIDLSWREYLQNYYDTHSESDYYVPPVLLQEEGQIQPEDIVINFDYRTDRMRQISSVLCDPSFSEFSAKVQISPENYGIFGNYHSSAQVVFSFGSSDISHTLGEIVSQNGLSQLRITETEKFNHVTFFFSGERKEAFPHEERILLPSPKCASYAEKPEMSAREQTDKLIQATDQKDYALIVQNYANGDLVGHSGSFEAAVQAVEVLDQCLAREVPDALAKGYEVIIIADHGNCDQMYYPDGQPNASHTKNLVPCVLVSPFYKDVSLLQDHRSLQDVAPTILDILGLEKPPQMTGESLIQK